MVQGVNGLGLGFRDFFRVLSFRVWGLTIRVGGLKERGLKVRVYRDPSGMC